MFKKNIVILLSDVIACLNFILKKSLAFLGLKRPISLRILVYHSVSSESFYKDLGESNVSVDMFREQMRYLKKKFKKIVSLTEGVDCLRKSELGQDFIVITFDDGMADVYEEAIGVLEDLKIPAIFFIVYKYADSDDGRFMDWSKVDR